MDEIITFSSAVRSQSPEVSAKEVDHLENPPDFKEVHAKLVFTDEQVRSENCRWVLCMSTAPKDYFLQSLKPR